MHILNSGDIVFSIHSLYIEHLLRNVLILLLHLFGTDKICSNYVIDPSKENNFSTGRVSNESFVKIIPILPPLEIGWSSEQITRIWKFPSKLRPWHSGACSRLWHCITVFQLTSKYYEERKQQVATLWAYFRRYKFAWSETNLGNYGNFLLIAAKIAAMAAILAVVSISWELQ